MQHIKMKKLTFIIALLGLLCNSCNNSQNEKSNKIHLTEAKGGRFYGGVFRMSESEYIKTLFPHSIIDVYSYRVASQVYEGLFKFDQKDVTKLINGLVDTYTVDETKTVYTFKLKQNIYFHDDECFPNGKGRKVTTEDIKYCFTLLCKQDRNNQHFNLFDKVVKGVNKYYDGTKGGKIPNHEVEGFNVIDDLTFEITLIKPSSIFLYSLARPGAFIFPREAYEKYGLEMRIKCVGTGPYKLSFVDEDISIILKKNEKYYGKDEYGNQLPFLDALSIQFFKDKKVELLEFRKGNLDMMYRIPTDYIIEILAETDANSDGTFSKYVLEREPEMATQFLSLFNQGDIFNSLNVRKAFSFAINRQKILDFVLNGEGYEIGKYGFTPPSFKAYDVTGIKGYTFNLDSARYYLKKAGFINGRGFPKLSLDLNAEGDRYVNVAVEVQKQLKDHLNINIELNIAPISQITEKGMSGKYDMLRLAWIADFPSPQSFLWPFYGKNIPKNLNQKSFPNIARYSNDTFDKLYEQGLNSTSDSEALAFFMKAEQILIDDAPVIVLWYDEGYRLQQSFIKNFPSNPMQYRDFSQVYLIPKSSDKEI